MNEKIALIDPIKLHAECVAQIEEYRTRHRVGLAFTAFLTVAIKRRNVDRRITALMHDKLFEHGFPGGEYTLSYSKDQDFMNRDRYTIGVTWRATNKTDKLSWYFEQSKEATDHSLLGFSLLQSHADFLQSKLVEIDYMVRRHNNAVKELTALAENTKLGIFPVHPLSKAFHYYELT